MVVDGDWGLRKNRRGKQERLVKCIWKTCMDWELVRKIRKRKKRDIIEIGSC